MQKAELLTSRPESLLQVTLLLAAVAALVIVPPAWVERLPSICLNRHIFGFCPACGSLRALVYLFHGALGRAMEYNLNCLLTGPILIILLLANLRRTWAGQR